jgi:putative spermidine/putrescine transport system permease protein
MLIVPYLVYLGCVFLTPLADMALRSVDGADVNTRHYARLLGEPMYARVFLNTGVLAGAVTLLALVLGYPLAFVLWRATPRTRRLLFIAIAVPFWTSILVRSYAWLVILQQRGVVNELLVRAHILERPIQLVYNATGVVLGMTYVLLPFMVLSLYTALRNIDTALPIVAATLGANRQTVFWRIIVPLSWPGITAGVSIVFVLGLGFFVTPALLGGLGQTTVGMLIDAQMNRVLDWGFGSAIAILLTAVIMTVASVAYRNAAVRRLAGNGLHMEER